MTSRDFCFWLQGYFEIQGATGLPLQPEQVECIKRHLSLVFKHEIDPSMGPKDHQALLDIVHSPALAPPWKGAPPDPSNKKLRC